jgi:hypothetical protein
MVLIQFLLAGEHIKDQELHSMENIITIVLLLAIVVFVLGDTSMRDFVSQ